MPDICDLYRAIVERLAADDPAHSLGGGRYQCWYCTQIVPNGHAVDCMWMQAVDLVAHERGNRDDGPIFGPVDQYIYPAPPAGSELTGIHTDHGDGMVLLTYRTPDACLFIASGTMHGPTYDELHPEPPEDPDVTCDECGHPEHEWRATRSHHPHCSRYPQPVQP